MINAVIGHLFHIVPGARYRRMYGSHFSPYTYQIIEQTADHFHWDQGEEHWAVAKKDGMSDGTDDAGGGHVHTGLMIYQGNNWPAEYDNALVTANFHGRRLNVDTVHREGNSYVGHHGADILKTTDPWFLFRGVEMIYGPDGGVFFWIGRTLASATRTMGFIEPPAEFSSSFTESPTQSSHRTCRSCQTMT